MEDQNHMPVNDTLVSKPRKKKPVAKQTEAFHLPANANKKPSQKGQKAAKRGMMKNEVSPLFQPERLIPDPSTSGDDYRALRRKYLLLEEESFGLGRELKTVEDDIQTLEEEKLSLLDELVVLEGLIDPSELQTQGKRLQ